MSAQGPMHDSDRMSAAHGSFVARLKHHIRWQREQLASAAPSTQRFFVLRPGDRFTVCSAGGLTRKASHNASQQGCIALHMSGQLPGHRSVLEDPRIKEYRGHWDDLASKVVPNYTRHKSLVGGLGNIMESLISAAAVAMLSKRILLIENMTDWHRSYGWPLTELVLEGGAFESSLLHAQDGEESRLDSYLAHDDYTAASVMCSEDLRTFPAKRVWRLFSNQYFLPLLLLNPHHRGELASMASQSAAGGSHERRSKQPPPVFWGPALNFLLRPLPHVTTRAEALYDSRFRGEPFVSIHLRCALIDGRCNFRYLKRAAECARRRLAAVGAKRLYIAALQQGHRDYVASRLNSTVSVVWYGEAVEKQDQSQTQEESRLVDLNLLMRAQEMILAASSTFSHMARAMAIGTPARWYDDCEPVAPEATEAFLHMTKPIFQKRRGRQGGTGSCLDANASTFADRDQTAAALTATRGLMPYFDRHGTTAVHVG